LILQGISGESDKLLALQRDFRLKEVTALRRKQPDRVAQCATQVRACSRNVALRDRRNVAHYRAIALRDLRQQALDLFGWRIARRIHACELRLCALLARADGGGGCE